MYRIKTFLCAVCALVCTVLGVVAVRYMNTARLAQIEGERVYYTRYASSNALVKTELGLLDIFQLRGESVRFACKVDEEETVNRLIKAYGAEIFIKEDACGVRSYYAYSPKLGKGINIDGVTINLHIAFQGEACAVGTPIIFGGF